MLYVGQTSIESAINVLRIYRDVNGDRYAFMKKFSDLEKFDISYQTAQFDKDTYFELIDMLVKNNHNMFPDNFVDLMKNK